MLWYAVTLAFFGLLRVSEYTASYTHSYPVYTLMNNDVKDIDRSFLYIFIIKKFHGNIVFFAYESIYHWKGNYIILILVKILLKKISYFRCY